MVAAGLLARNAVRARPASRSRGSRRASRPARASSPTTSERAGLLEPLDALRLQPRRLRLHDLHRQLRPAAGRAVAEAVAEHDLAVVSVLSGNRNFEGRIHPQVRASYLASPPLVVAYALAGTIDIDLDERAARHRPRRRARVPARPLAARRRRCAAVIDAQRHGRALRAASTRTIWDGDERWRAHGRADGRSCSPGTPDSTYVREPTFFTDLGPEPAPLTDVVGARVLALLGDSVTTDHISPAGSIPPDGPAGRYLIEHGVERRDFNSFGSRRGNHEVMVRGTFANIRLRNALVPGVEGGVTVHLAERRAALDLRRRRALPRRGRAAGGARRARSTAPARRATGRPRARCCSASGPSSPSRTSASTARTSSGMGVLPLQFRRRRVGRVARPDRPRGVHDPRRRPSVAAAPDRDGRGDVAEDGTTTHLRGAGPRRLAGRASSTSATAASCRWCCGG